MLQLLSEVRENKYYSAKIELKPMTKRIFKLKLRIDIQIFLTHLLMVFDDEKKIYFELFQYKPVFVAFSVKRRPFLENHTCEKKIEKFYF